jgi:hypothetical protein
MDLVKNSSSRIDSSAIRRNYSTPTLTRFGKVSQLTQTASGCTQADNPGCTSGANNDMGPKIKP